MAAAFPNPNLKQLCSFAMILLYCCQIWGGSAKNRRRTTR